MGPAIQEEIKNLKGDCHFVQFVRAWHGDIGTTEVPFTSEKDSPSYQKKLMRWTRRDFGDNSKFFWRVILYDCLKMRRKTVLRRNLFKLEPIGPKLKHRPRNEARWNAAFDLRSYFEKKTGQPCMALLRRIFYPKMKERRFEKEWEKRQGWFEEEDKADRLEQLESFYRHNQARILETLRTGIPFYAKWESLSGCPDGGVAPLKPDTRRWIIGCE
jgi:hypothetical protein